MNISIGDSEGRVRLQGSLSLRDAKQVQGLLLDAISASREVEIDVSDVSSIDVIIVQLIASARKSAEQRGRKLTLAGSSSAFRATLAKTGFLGDDGDCRRVDEEFWTGGGLQKAGSAA